MAEEIAKVCVRINFLMEITFHWWIWDWVLKQNFFSYGEDQIEGNPHLKLGKNSSWILKFPFIA